MTFAAELGKAGKRLAWLLEIEIAKRIDNLSWTQVSGSEAFWIAITEPPPSRVRGIDLETHEVSEWEEESDVAGVEAVAGSWFYDGAAGRLYVHPTSLGIVSGSGSASDTTLPAGAPDGGDYFIAMYFWRCFCDGQYPAPEELVFNGIWYDPRLKKDSIPDLSQEITGFQDGGIRQTWGEMRLTNGDGKLDQEIADYVWENKVYVLKLGSPGDAYGDFVTISRGRTGSIGWDDALVSVGVEDPMRAED